MSHDAQVKLISGPFGLSVGLCKENVLGPVVVQNRVVSCTSRCKIILRCYVCQTPEEVLLIHYLPFSWLFFLLLSVPELQICS